MYYLGGTQFGDTRGAALEEPLASQQKIETEKHQTRTTKHMRESEKLNTNGKYCQKRRNEINNEKMDRKS